MLTEFTTRESIGAMRLFVVLAIYLNEAVAAALLPPTWTTNLTTLTIHNPLFPVFHADP